MKPIDELKALDLSKYPRESIKELIGQFGKFGMMGLVLHKGKSTIIRARPNETSGPFTERGQLIYKPAAFNKTYQRASTPNQTMFYAGILPDEVRKGELEYARITAAMEVSHLLRNDVFEGEEKLTFSHWVATGDITLAAIVYNEDMVNAHRHTREMEALYTEGLTELTEEQRAHSREVTEFLANEYAKKGIEDGEDYKYMISAIFSEITVNKGLAGVYYPSVQAKGHGYNVAICPEYVDNSLKLISVAECTIYKRGKEVRIDNETVCEVADDSKPFKLEAVDPSLHVGRDVILRELNSIVK